MVMNYYKERIQIKISQRKRPIDQSVCVCVKDREKGGKEP